MEPFRSVRRVPSWPRFPWTSDALPGWSLTALGLAVSAMSLSAYAEVAVQAGQTRTFSIAPGPLHATLLRFARETGIDLAYDTALLGDSPSPGLHGSYTIPDGLRALLEGSGLQAVALPGGGFAVRRVPTLPTVTVTDAALHPGQPAPGFAGDQIARTARLGMLGDTDVMDAPVQVLSYTDTAIRDQQAQTAGDMVANDASVRFASQPGGILDAFTIRGFPVNSGNFGEVALDGMYGVASNYRVSTGYIERIELIKGPTGLLTGMAPGGSVGGSLNIVPKRATDADLTRVTLDYATAAQLGGNLDLGRRFGPGGAFGVRLNGNYRSGETGLDNQSRNAGAGALALDYRGERLRATLDVIDQYEKIRAPSRLLHIVPGIAVPEAPDGRRNIAQTWENSRIHDQSLLVRVEVDLADHVTWFAGAGGGRTRVARLFAITPTIVNEAGDVVASDSNYRFNVARSSAETGLRARFDTGPVGHRLSVVVNAYRDQLDRNLVNSATISQTNMYNPVPLPVQAIDAPANVPKVSENWLSGVALADTLSMWDERAQLTLGLRHQRVRSENFLPTGGTASSYDQAALTPMVGLVVKPADHVSLYANRIEGLSRGDTAPNSASNAGEVFAPYKSRQYEVGVKVEGRQIMGSVSAFQITKRGGQMTGSVFTADGSQRNRGLEFALYGTPVTGLRLLASAMVLDATVTGSATPGTQGKAPIGVAPLQANFGAEWDTGMLPGLTLTGAVAYTGHQYVDAENTQRIPHWTRLDLGLRYRTTAQRKPVVLRLNVRNVLNTRGWAAVDAYGGLAIADPRTVQVSVSMDF